MTSCELCGKETELVLAKVEGSEMNVCSSCGSFGTILKRPQTGRRHKEIIKKRSEPEAEPEEVIVGNYSERIRKARNKLNMTQKEFANHLNEKESIVHKIENGSFHLSIDLARKFEKRLKIRLVELDKKESPTFQEEKKSGPLTIGDILKVKK